MKKGLIIVLVIIAVIVIGVGVLIASLNKEKVAITPSTFKTTMESKGYILSDVTSQFAQYGNYVLKAYVAQQGTDYQILGTTGTTSTTGATSATTTTTNYNYEYQYQMPTTTTTTTKTTKYTTTTPVTYTQQQFTTTSPESYTQQYTTSQPVYTTTQQTTYTTSVPTTTTSVGATPKVQLLRRGSGISPNEQNGIITTAMAVFQNNILPLSNNTASRIKKIVGGDWLVIVYPQNKPIDFNMTCVQGNDYLYFTLDNLAYQVCRLT